MIVILCVDGLDPDLVKEFGLDHFFKYNKTLKIPKECYFYWKQDGKIYFTPHTTRIWPTIFSGKIIDYDVIRRKGLRSIAHDFLVKLGLKWYGSKEYRISPTNIHLDIFTNHYRSYLWNIPTISPDWISHFPDYDSYLVFQNYEWKTFKMISRQIANELFEVAAIYTRYIDHLGHKGNKEMLESFYNYIFDLADLLKNKVKVIILSDHGTVNGEHTEQAYIGSDYPILAESVEELRHDFERIIEESK